MGELNFIQINYSNEFQVVYLEGETQEQVLQKLKDYLNLKDINLECFLENIEYRNIIEVYYALDMKTPEFLHKLLINNKPNELQIIKRFIKLMSTSMDKYISKQKHFAIQEYKENAKLDELIKLYNERLQKVITDQVMESISNRFS